nr:hypothetical protein Itr_chr01CG06740 [Ipomoea trifida]
MVVDTKVITSARLYELTIAPVKSIFTNQCKRMKGGGGVGWQLWRRKASASPVASDLLESGWVDGELDASVAGSTA